MSNLVVEAVPRSQTGVASGMNANIRTVGGAIGGAVLGCVVTAGARPTACRSRPATRTASPCSRCSAVAAVVALAVPVVKARTHLVPGPQTESEAALVAGASWN